MEIIPYVIGVESYLHVGGGGEPEWTFVGLLSEPQSGALRLRWSRKRFARGGLGILPQDFFTFEVLFIEFWEVFNQKIFKNSVSQRVFFLKNIRP